jgi:CxxC-x17-CxxC domain-containing protein
MSFEDTNDQPRASFAPREMIKGNWKCSECGAEITELPFQPAEDRPIYCKECWKNRKPTNFRR